MSRAKEFGRLLCQISDAKIRLRFFDRGRRLQYRGPKEVLTREFVDRLRFHKRSLWQAYGPERLED